MATTISPFDTDIGGTGLRLQPGLGRAYPELKRLMLRFYQERVARLPWLPPNWLAAAQDIQARVPDDLVVIARKNWGDAEVWTALAADSDAIRAKYAAGKAAEGREILDEVNRDAAFWNAAYRVAVIAESPIEIAKKAGGVVGEVTGGIVDKTVTGALNALSNPVKIGLALVAVGFLIFYAGPIIKLFKGSKA